MKMVVPTFLVTCTLREAVAGKKAGEMVTLAYGCALQGMARGVLGVMVQADEAHENAMKFLDQYGADSWFPADLQTLDRFVKAAKAGDNQVDMRTVH